MIDWEKCIENRNDKEKKIMHPQNIIFSVHTVTKEVPVLDINQIPNINEYIEKINKMYKEYERIELIKQEIISKQLKK